MAQPSTGPTSSAAPGPLRHPAVWTGAELAARGDWEQAIGAEERDELLALAGNVRCRDGADGGATKPTFDGRPLESTSAADLPAPRFAARLAGVREQLEHGAGAALIHGLPIDGLSEAEARAVFWAAAVHLGTPVSQSAAGERIFSVRDAGFAEGDPRARGPNTRKRLSFHTDRCDVIGFLCLRPAAEGGDNEVVSSMAVYNAIRERRPDLLEVLREPFYYLRHTVDTGNDRPWCRQPVFSFREGHFACCFLRVLIERAHGHPDLPGLTGPQREALDLVEAVAAEPGMALGFRQGRGDLLLLNNWVTLHRRTAFTDHPEPERRRHILRAWVAVPNSRPLDPAFADNYGSAEPGAVRGGMRVG